MRLGKGVADLHRRAEVSQTINDRYASTLATVASKEGLAELAADLGERTEWKGRSVRGLNPLSARDAELLAAVSRGAFLISGFRNHDIRAALFPGPEPTERAEQTRRSRAVTRMPQLLRAHGLIQKVPKPHRYQVTERGRAQVTALLAANVAGTKRLRGRMSDPPPGARRAQSLSLSRTGRAWRGHPCPAR